MDQYPAEHDSTNWNFADPVGDIFLEGTADGDSGFPGNGMAFEDTTMEDFGDLGDAVGDEFLDGCSTAVPRGHGKLEADLSSITVPPYLISLATASAQNISQGLSRSAEADGADLSLFPPRKTDATDPWSLNQLVQRACLILKHHRTREGYDSFCSLWIKKWESQVTEWEQTDINAAAALHQVVDSLPLLLGHKDEKLFMDCPINKRFPQYCKNRLCRTMAIVRAHLRYPVHEQDGTAFNYCKNCQRDMIWVFQHEICAYRKSILMGEGQKWIALYLTLYPAEKKVPSPYNGVCTDCPAFVVERIRAWLAEDDFNNERHDSASPMGETLQAASKAEDGISLVAAVGVIFRFAVLMKDEEVLALTAPYDPPVPYVLEGNA